MFQPGQEIFIDAESGARRFLAAFRVESAEGSTMALRPETPDAAAPTPGQSVTLCYSKGPSFMRADARVDSASADGVLRVEVLSEPRVCESREVFRASVEGAGFVAVLDGRQKCDIVDVSPSGLGILSKNRRFADEGIPVELEVDGKSFKGPCVVRNVRQTPLGWRAGLECINGSKANLRTGLQKLTMKAQRLNLRRDQDDQQQAA